MKFGRGRAMVELGDELERDVTAAIDRMAPGLRDRLGEAVRGIAEPAQAQWPVKSGESKAAFEHGVRMPDMDHLQGYVINTAEHGGKEYAYLIKSKVTGYKPTWRALVEKPAEPVIDRLADDLVDAAARILDGGA